MSDSAELAHAHDVVEVLASAPATSAELAHAHEIVEIDPPGEAS